MRKIVFSLAHMKLIGNAMVNMNLRIVIAPINVDKITCNGSLTPHRTFQRVCDVCVFYAFAFTQAHLCQWCGPSHPAPSSQSCHCCPDTSHIIQFQSYKRVLDKKNQSSETYQDSTVYKSTHVCANNSTVFVRVTCRNMREIVGMARDKANVSHFDLRAGAKFYSTSLKHQLGKIKIEER